MLAAVKHEQSRYSSNYKSRSDHRKCTCALPHPTSRKRVLSRIHIQGPRLIPVSATKPSQVPSAHRTLQQEHASSRLRRHIPDTVPKIALSIAAIGVGKRGIGAAYRAAIGNSRVGVRTIILGEGDGVEECAIARATEIVGASDRSLGGAGAVEGYGGGGCGSGFLR